MFGSASIPNTIICHVRLRDMSEREGYNISLRKFFLWFFRILSLGKMCNTTGPFMRTFPLYLCYHQMQRNLMYVQNVGNNLHRKEALLDTCWFTLAFVHTLVLFATTKRYTNTLSSSIYAPILVTNPTLAVTATLDVHVNTVSPYTYAHTQGETILLWCVREILFQKSWSKTTPTRSYWREESQMWPVWKIICT